MTPTGRRDTLIIIEHRQTTIDPIYGTTVEGPWIEHARAWAEVLDVLPSRAEEIADGVDIARRPARIRIDFFDGLGVTTSMRVVILADAVTPERRLSIIAGPAQKGRRDEWEFIAEELSTEGEAP
jgi:hypothetical protein